MSTNLPIPAGYKLLPQLAVTPAMTAWAVKILRDPSHYPMLSTARLVFDNMPLLARVEWHPPDFQNHSEHRGVTLYEPVATTPSVTVAAGIDVSAYQPRVDWPAVAAGGVSFTFIKASEASTLVDASFADHWAAAKKAGLLRGAYHYFRPQVDARAQAQHFLAQLGDRGELPPVLDAEAADGAVPAKIIAGIHTWLDVVGATFKPLIYTSPSFWNALPGTAEIETKADLWVAQWGDRAPTEVNGWSNWKFWQFTNKAHVLGIPGTADQDENHFNGSLADLQAYSAAYLSALPRPSPASFNLKTTLGVQQALNFLHVADPPLSEDGVVGPKTWEAVEAFQKRAALRIDGIPGPNTIAALQKALRLTSEGAP